MVERQITFRPSKSLCLFDERAIFGHWWVDSDVVFKRGEVEERLFFLERGKVVADGLRAVGNESLDFLLDLLKSVAKVFRLRCEVFVVGLEGHVDFLVCRMRIIFAPQLKSCPHEIHD